MGFNQSKQAMVKQRSLVIGSGLSASVAFKLLSTEVWALSASAAAAELISVRQFAGFDSETFAF